MHKAGRNRRLRKTHQAEALRVRAFDRDLRRANGIMASGIWKGRMTGRTHGRTDQRWADAAENPCQRRAVHTRPHAGVEGSQDESSVKGGKKLRIYKSKSGVFYRPD